MGAVLSVTTCFAQINCCNCGVPFMVPDWLEADLRRTHRYFYCPNGHNQHFTAETEAEKLKKQLAKAETHLKTAQSEAAWQQSQREQAERSARAQKAIATKIKNRLARGLCPCCGKHFPELREHITERHPNYAPVDDVTTAVK